jgi:hypothetical protein
VLGIVGAGGRHPPPPPKQYCYLADHCPGIRLCPVSVQRALRDVNLFEDRIVRSRAGAIAGAITIDVYEHRNRGEHLAIAWADERCACGTRHAGPASAPSRPHGRYMRPGFRRRPIWFSSAAGRSRSRAKLETRRRCG